MTAPVNEPQTLQNAVTAAGHQIDALVYELEACPRRQYEFSARGGASGSDWVHLLPATYAPLGFPAVNFRTNSKLHKRISSLPSVLQTSVLSGAMEMSRWSDFSRKSSKPH